MKYPIHFLLIGAAILLFLFAGVGGKWPSPETTTEWPWRFRLLSIGLFCWALSTIVVTV